MHIDNDPDKIAQIYRRYQSQSFYEDVTSAQTDQEMIVCAPIHRDKFYRVEIVLKGLEHYQQIAIRNAGHDCLH